MERIYLELTVLAAGWGAGVLLIAAGWTVVSAQWQRVAATTLGVTLLAGISAYALLPLR